MRIASAVVHRGEEPPLVTGTGSGTVFFTGCTLGCPFCQNRQVSSGGMGREVEPGTLADICKALEAAGASNINLVTGTHFIPGIVTELGRLRGEGFGLPVVWNSSGYESPEGLALIDPLVDVYLLDIKAVTPEAAEALFGRRDYPRAARKTAEFATGRHPLRYEGDALAGGTVIRHLVMPGMETEAERVIEWFGDHLAGRALFSLMVQYIPPAGEDYKRIDDGYYNRLLDLLDRAGIEDGFIQAPADSNEWLPDFTEANPFPTEYADPVWHWNNGFLGGTET